MSMWFEKKVIHLISSPFFNIFYVLSVFKKEEL